MMTDFDDLLIFPPFFQAVKAKLRSSYAYGNRLGSVEWSLDQLRKKGRLK